METKNHLELAVRIMKEDWFVAGRLSRLLFALGNIYPDINIFTYFRGHTEQAAQKSLAKLMARPGRSGRLTAWDYWRLGVALHYVADMFTTCHNSGYTGGMLAHRRYEKGLRANLRARLGRLRPLRLRAAWRDPLAYLKKRHREYIAQAWHPERDCAYIVGVCREMALLAGGYALAQRTHRLPGLPETLDADMS